jgi:uncharacterized damage-inducible protein DinB
MIFRKFFSVASKADAMEEWTRDLKNSFPSVRDTLVHILWAEWMGDGIPTRPSGKR